MAGKATLEEIETHWSLDDLDMANAALDLSIELENNAIKAAKTNKG